MGNKLGLEHPNADRSKIAIEFDNWYQETYGDPLWGKQRRSPRYYELKKAWIASKKFYSSKA